MLILKGMGNQYIWKMILNGVVIIAENLESLFSQIHIFDKCLINNFDDIL